ncbi:MAG: hypothetical protein ABIW76_05965 [Fibrobacteria bacterium]
MMQMQTQTQTQTQKKVFNGFIFQSLGGFHSYLMRRGVPGRDDDDYVTGDREGWRNPGFGPRAEANGFRLSILIKPR